MTKHPIALCLRRQERKKIFSILHLAFTFTLECLVFPKQSLDICSKDEANKKECVLNCKRDKCSRHGACIKHNASVRVIFPTLLVCFIWAQYVFHYFLFQMCLKIWSLYKLTSTVMNVFSFVENKYLIRWNMKCSIQLCFTSLNRTITEQ